MEGRNRIHQRTRPARSAASPALGPVARGGIFASVLAVLGILIVGIGGQTLSYAFACIALVFCGALGFALLSLHSGLFRRHGAPSYRRGDGWIILAVIAILAYAYVGVSGLTRATDSTSIATALLVAFLMAALGFGLAFELLPKDSLRGVLRGRGATGNPGRSRGDAQ